MIDNLLPAVEPEKPDSPVVIAGPCSAETESQVLSTASGLSSCGISVFRAGVWKPRTKPGGFEGVGAVGLKWLKKARLTTGMLIATEVATRYHVEEALRAGIDILWIGARTSANPFAVQEIADTLAERGADVSVLVKNPVNPDLELWIGALERIYNAGIRRLGAVHRGFSAYGEHSYRNMPQWHIPIELRRRIPGMQLFCDPSHIGGRRDLIAPLSQQAIDMQFDGLMIESHCSPDEAWSDSAQQVTPGTLAEILKSLVVRNSENSSDRLSELRKEIDEADSELLELLARRMRISREIGLYKKEHSMPVVQSERYGNLMSSRVATAAGMGLPEPFIRSVLQSIHEESVRQQIELINRGSDI